MEGLSILTLSKHAARKKSVFAALEALLKLGGHCDVCEWAVVSSLLSASHRYNALAYNCPVPEWPWTSK